MRFGILTCLNVVQLSLTILADWFAELEKITFLYISYKHWYVARQVL